MKEVNHVRNAARLIIVVFWLVVVGLAYTAYANLTNVFALSWATWLLYATVTIVLLYAGVVLTSKFWNLK